MENQDGQLPFPTSVDASRVLVSFGEIFEGELSQIRQDIALVSDWEKEVQLGSIVKRKSQELEGLYRTQTIVERIRDKCVAVLSKLE